MGVGALRYLLDCHSECEYLDYKEALYLEQPSQIADFVRDVLGIKNVGGGYIIVGVRDKTWEPVGLPNRLPYDTKGLRDKVRSASAVELELDIVQLDLPIADSQRLFALVYIRSTRKRHKLRIPTVTQRDYHPTKSFGLRPGEIYMRKGDTTTRITSAEDLQDLLEGLELRAIQDDIELQKQRSPFAIEDGTYRLLERGFETFVGREALREKLINVVESDPRIWIVNVHGPGGVGKSALVNWAVYKFYEQRAFEGIIHLTAKDTMLTELGIRPITRSLHSLEGLLDQVLSTYGEAAPEDLEHKKKLATEVLCAYRTLLVLDNMETVSDGRVLSLIQSLPPESKTKVLLTSRTRSSGWELPIPVSELNQAEVRDFVRVKAREQGIAFPVDESTIARVTTVTGGLPLAIQWILGQYKLSGNLHTVLPRVDTPDSPILEFSFRNIWKLLSPQARGILAISTIFDSPPNLRDIAIATELPPEWIEKALAELGDATLVTPDCPQVRRRDRVRCPSHNARVRPEPTGRNGGL